MSEINSNTYRRVESLLYNYKTFDAAIASLEAELEDILPSPGSSVAMAVGHENSPGDTSQTERWALIRSEGPSAVRIAKLLKRKKDDKARVERALAALSSLERDLVKHKYDEEKPNNVVMKKLGMARMSYFRLKNVVVKKAAKYMGYL
mgnify:CR=1 FL=1